MASELGLSSVASDSTPLHVEFPLWPALLLFWLCRTTLLHQPPWATSTLPAIVLDALLLNGTTLAKSSPLYPRDRTILQGKPGCCSYHKGREHQAGWNNRSPCPLQTCSELSADGHPEMRGGMHPSYLKLTIKQISALPEGTRPQSHRSWNCLPRDVPSTKSVHMIS